MRTFSTLLLVFTVFLASGCGRGLETYHSEGLEQAGLLDGILTIPAQGVASGRSYINSEYSSYYIDLEGSDPAAIEYLTRLGARQVSVSRTEIYGSILYSIRFSGVQDEGTCPFSSSQVCRRIKLSSLVAY
jgi:hypothetical protein